VKVDGVVPVEKKITGEGKKVTAIGKVARSERLERTLTKSTGKANRVIARELDNEGKVEGLGGSAAAKDGGEGEWRNSKKLRESGSQQQGDKVL